MHSRCSGSSCVLQGHAGLPHTSPLPPAWLPPPGITALLRLCHSSGRSGLLELAQLCPGRSAWGTLPAAPFPISTPCGRIRCSSAFDSIRGFAACPRAWLLPTELCVPHVRDLVLAPVNSQCPSCPPLDKSPVNTHKLREFRFSSLAALDPTLRLQNVYLKKEKNPRMQEPKTPSPRKWPQTAEFWKRGC